MSTSGGSSGGTITFPTYAGAGVPEGSQVGALGTSYVDTTNGALWFKSVAGGNTGWIAMNRIPSSFNYGRPLVGFDSGATRVNIIGPSTGDVQISDQLGYAGTGNGIYYVTNGTDAQQIIQFLLGTSPGSTWSYNANGTSQFPGNLLMAGNKVTGLANGTAATDAAAFGQVPPLINSTISVVGSGTTASTSYVNLSTTSAAVTLTTNTMALVAIHAEVSNGTLNDGCLVSFKISGATTVAASDQWSVGEWTNPAGSVTMAGATVLCAGSSNAGPGALTAGSNTFTVQAKAITGGTATIADAYIAVFPLN